MDSGWAQLPDDLLCDIAMRLECVEDMIAFGDVCLSWRAAYMSLKAIWTPTMPWLILAENNDDNPLCIRTVVDLNTNKRRQMKLPETFGQRCWGCEDGWIFTLSLDAETHLFNPLTGAWLDLPSALKLPSENSDVNYYDPEHREFLMRHYIQKVHVITIPPNDWLLVMVIYHKNGLAIAEPWDSEWRSLEHLRHPEQHYLLNVVYYGHLIVGVYEDGAVKFINADFFLREDNPIVEAAFYLPKYIPEFECSRSVYLVEDYCRNILAVVRYASPTSDPTMDIDEILFDPYDSGAEWEFFDPYDSGAEWEFVDDPTVSYETWLFEVYSFDMDKRDWSRVYYLGDMALFVGNNVSVCAMVPEGSNCKPNCIYFTDERPYDTKVLGHDSGVFNMKDEIIERVYHGVDILSKFCPPFWYMPMLV